MADSNANIKHKALSGIIWQFLQQTSSQLVGFAVSVVLARLLMPEEFGLVALTGIFIAIASVFADSGLGSALIQKNEVDEMDYNTVYFTGLALSTLLFSILFFIAPLVASIYGQPQVCNILRVLGLGLFISNYCSIQRAVIIRKLDFRRFFYVSLIAGVISGVMGIILAFRGWGVWAIVASNLLTGVVTSICLDRVSRWRPHLQFSWLRLKSLYSFGLNMMGTSLMGTFFNELRGFLIGAKYAPTDLAFYNRGEGIPSILNRNITGVVSGVLFPTMSKLQDDKAAIKNAMRRSMMTCSFFIAPAMLILSVVSDKIIILLYTDKWASAIPFMQIVCLAHIPGILSTTNLQALMAVGRTDITFRLEFIKKPIYLVILLYTMTISPLAMAIGNTVYNFIGTAINIYPNRKIVGYSFGEQIKDVAPSLSIAAIAATASFIVGTLKLNIVVLLFVQVATGVAVFCLLSVLFKLESYSYILDTIKGFAHKKKPVGKKKSSDTIEYGFNE